MSWQQRTHPSAASDSGESEFRYECDITCHDEATQSWDLHSLRCEICWVNHKDSWQLRDKTTSLSLSEDQCERYLKNYQMFCCLRSRSTVKVWSSKSPSRNTLTIFSQCYHWNLWVTNWDWKSSHWEEHLRCDWTRTDVFKRAQSSYVLQSNTYLEHFQQLW